jgi:hypothetical protein
MLAAFDGSQRDGINDQPRLEARLDREQAANLPQHTLPLEILKKRTAHTPF